MTPASKLSIGLLLTAAAGFIDGVGFVELGGLYTSFMSGNTTQLGLYMGHGQLAPLLLPAFLILCFLFGSVAGSMLVLRRADGGAGAVLIVVSVLVGLCVLLRLLGVPSQVALLSLAVATGMQNAAIPPAGAARLGASYVTGTLFSAGQDLARALFRRAPAWRFAQHLAVWWALLAGALAGGLCYPGWGIWSLLVPLLAYLLCLALTVSTGRSDA